MLPSLPGDDFPWMFCYTLCWLAEFEGHEGLYGLLDIDLFLLSHGEKCPTPLPSNHYNKHTHALRKARTESLVKMSHTETVTLPTTLSLKMSHTETVTLPTTLSLPCLFLTLTLSVPVDWTLSGTVCLLPASFVADYRALHDRYNSIDDFKKNYVLSRCACENRQN